MFLYHHLVFNLKPTKVSSEFTVKLATYVTPSVGWPTHSACPPGSHRQKEIYGENTKKWSLKWCRTWLLCLIYLDNTLYILYNIVYDIYISIHLLSQFYLNLNNLFCHWRDSPDEPTCIGGGDRRSIQVISQFYSERCHNLPEGMIVGINWTAPSLLQRGLPLDINGVITPVNGLING